MVAMGQPTVSIIIPAAGAAGSIGAALDSVAAQDYPAIADVVVAAADPATAEAATRSGVRVVENPTGSTPAGLNRAIAATVGEYVVRLDAHSTIPSDYVTRVVELLETTGAWNVGGMQVPIGQSFWGRAIAAAMTSRAGSGDARYRVGGKPGPVDTVYLGAYPRRVLEDLGGYDDRYVRHQDFELNQRIRETGGQVWFDPEIRVAYRPRDSLSDLARQYFHYGVWKRRFSQRHRRALRARQLAPPVLVLSIVVTIGLGFVWPWLLAFPGVYLGSLAVAGIAAIPKAGIASVGVPTALATMHFAWGFGFLFGQAKEA